MSAHTAHLPASWHFLLLYGSGFPGSPAKGSMRDSVPEGASSFLSDWSRKNRGWGLFWTEIVVDYLPKNRDPWKVYGQSGQEEEVILGVGNLIF